MSTYLLKWNPTAWSEEKFRRDHAAYLAGKSVNWSCGNTKRILPGDTVYLLRTKEEPRGIVGRGVVKSPPQHRKHYDVSRGNAGETVLSIEVHFQFLWDLVSPIPIARHELDAPDLTAKVWNVQGSGKRIPDEIANSLNKLWNSRGHSPSINYADEVAATDKRYIEGAVRHVQVNAYERNPDARAVCIAHWGATCQVCGFDFAKVYGDIGSGYIHVHHLIPLSTLKRQYEVDPINELVPLCPNWQAMIHRLEDPFSVEGLKAKLQVFAEKNREC